MPAEPPTQTALTVADIAANVRAETARTRTSQATLTTLLNVSQSSVSMRLRGATPFSAHELAVVARHLGVPVAAFYQPNPPAS